MPLLGWSGAHGTVVKVTEPTLKAHLQGLLPWEAVLLDTDIHTGSSLELPAPTQLEEAFLGVVRPIIGSTNSHGARPPGALTHWLDRIPRLVPLIGGLPATSVLSC